MPPTFGPPPLWPATSSLLSLSLPQSPTALHPLSTTPSASPIPSITNHQSIPNLASPIPPASPIPSTKSVAVVLPLPSFTSTGLTKKTVWTTTKTTVTSMSTSLTSQPPISQSPLSTYALASKLLSSSLLASPPPSPPIPASRNPSEAPTRAPTTVLIVEGSKKFEGSGKVEGPWDVEYGNNKSAQYRDLNSKLEAHLRGILEKKYEQNLLYLKVKNFREGSIIFDFTVFLTSTTDVDANSLKKVIEKAEGGSANLTISVVSVNQVAGPTPSTPTKPSAASKDLWRNIFTSDLWYNIFTSDLWYNIYTSNLWYKIYTSDLWYNIYTSDVWYDIYTSDLWYNIYISNL
ncbi:uncharacterized protein LOC111345869 [Stylophora pistillata]|nr:uncharacterized protein LOC111345869 [Stylophora pistillata]